MAPFSNLGRAPHRGEHARGTAFAVDFATLFLLTCTAFFKEYYILAAVISFILGLATNYLFSVRWVFDRRKIENKPAEFLLFAVVGIVGLGINALFLWLFTDILFVQLISIPDKQIRIILSKIISTAFVYIWNFTARKIILF